MCVCVCVGVYECECVEYKSCSTNIHVTEKKNFCLFFKKKSHSQATSCSLWAARDFCSPTASNTRLQNICSIPSIRLWQPHRPRSRTVAFAAVHHHHRLRHRQQRIGTCTWQLLPWANRQKLRAPYAVEAYHALHGGVYVVKRSRRRKMQWRRRRRRIIWSNLGIRSKKIFFNNLTKKYLRL